MKYLIALIAALSFGSAIAGTPFAQLSSSQTQLGTGSVTFDQIDGISSLEYDAVTGLKINKAGLYLVIAAPQVITGMGCYDIWFNVNSVDVANSNVQYCSQGPKQTDVIVSQGVACYAKHDLFKLKQSGTGIKAIQEMFPEPLIPSIIFTMYRVGDC